MADVSNYSDVLDVRDIIERLEELEDERETLSDAVTDSKKAVEEFSPDEDGTDDEGNSLDVLREEVADAEKELSDWDQSEDGEELKTLRELLGELAGSGGDHQWRGDWYPVTLIRDSYWERYAEQFAEDIGAIQRDASWPYTCIDWEQAARELRMDYSSVEYGDVTFWYR